jgi:hypothetical protein
MSREIVIDPDINKFMIELFFKRETRDNYIQAHIDHFGAEQVKKELQYIIQTGNVKAPKDHPDRKDLRPDMELVYELNNMYSEYYVSVMLMEFGISVLD